MSILRQAAKDQRQQRLILLYSHRRPDDAAFLAELQQLESLSYVRHRTDPHGCLIYTDTRSPLRNLKAPYRNASALQPIRSSHRQGVSREIRLHTGNGSHRDVGSRRAGKKLAVAVVHRDLDGLRAELEFEQATAKLV